MSDGIKSFGICNLPIKVELFNFDRELIRLIDSVGGWNIVPFSDFEKSVKTLYSAYKKYKYVFEKGEK